MQQKQKTPSSRNHPPIPSFAIGDVVWTKGTIDFKGNKPFLPWIKGKVKSSQPSTCTLKCPRRSDRSCPWIAVDYMQPVVDRSFRLIDPKLRRTFAAEAEATGGFIKGKKHLKACELWSHPPSQVEPIAEFPAQVRQPFKAVKSDGFPAEIKLLEAEKLLRTLITQTDVELKLKNKKRAAELEDLCDEIVEACEKLAEFYKIKIDGSEENWVLYPSTNEAPWCNLAPIQKGIIRLTQHDNRHIQVKEFSLNYQPGEQTPQTLQVEIIGIYGSNEIRFTLADLQADDPPSNPTQPATSLRRKPIKTDPLPRKRKEVSFEQLSLSLFAETN